MDNKTFLITQVQIIETCRKAAAIDIEEFLNVLTNAEGILKEVNKLTMRDRALSNISAVKRLALALQNVKEEFEAAESIIMNSKQ